MRSKLGIRMHLEEAVAGTALLVLLAQDRIYVHGLILKYTELYYGAVLSRDGKVVH